MQNIPLEITYEVRPRPRLRLRRRGWQIPTLTRMPSTASRPPPNPNPNPNQDVKYSFTVSPRSPDTILLTINGKEILVKISNPSPKLRPNPNANPNPKPKQEILVKILQQADGSLFVSYGRESHRVFAREEPLGLRMVLGRRHEP